MSLTSGVSGDVPDFIEERLSRHLHPGWEMFRRQGDQPRYFYYLTEAVVGKFRVLSDCRKILVDKQRNGSLLGVMIYGSIGPIPPALFH